MDAPKLKVASLDDKRIAKVKALEQETGSVIVAYAQSAPRFARLSDDQVKRLESTEKELGVTLVAYDKSAGAR
jgi:hypothetical protein